MWAKLTQYWKESMYTRSRLQRKGKNTRGQRGHCSKRRYSYEMYRRFILKRYSIQVGVRGYGYLCQRWWRVWRSMDTCANVGDEFDAASEALLRVRRAREVERVVASWIVHRVACVAHYRLVCIRFHAVENKRFQKKRKKKKGELNNLEVTGRRI